MTGEKYKNSFKNGLLLWLSASRKLENPQGCNADYERDIETKSIFGRLFFPLRSILFKIYREIRLFGRSGVIAAGENSEFWHAARSTYTPYTEVYKAMRGKAEMSKMIYKSIFAITLFTGLTGRAVSVTVAWDPSTTTVDGELLEDVQCYKLFYSDASGVYSNFVEVADGTSAELTGVEYNKTLYFSVKTCTSTTESDFSDELVWTAPVMADEDNDGLSDDWERMHFDDLTAADSSTDSDGDGVADLAEFVAGTDPADSLDCPGLMLEGGRMLSFETRSVSGEGYQNRNRSYSLEFCEDLAAANWTPVPDLDQIAANGQIVRHEIAADSGNGFYRTQIELN
jgi:hypothetical protein